MEHVLYSFIYVFELCSLEFKCIKATLTLLLFSIISLTRFYRCYNYDFTVS